MADRRYFKEILKKFESSGYTRDIPMNVNSLERPPVKFVNYSQHLLEAHVGGGLATCLFTMTSAAFPGCEFFVYGIAPLRSFPGANSGVVINGAEWYDGTFFPTKVDVSVSSDLGLNLFLEISTKLAIAISKAEATGSKVDAQSIISSVLKEWQS